MMLCDSSNPGMDKGVYQVPYIEAVDGKFHAYESKGEVHWVRDWAHTYDPRCPECKKYGRNQQENPDE